jgi:hypothetical protein
VSASSILPISNGTLEELSPRTGFTGISPASRVILPSTVGIEIICYRLPKGLAALVAPLMSTPTL